MKQLALALLLTSLVAPSAAEPPSATPKYDPVEKYEEQTLEGWRILIHRDLLTNEKKSLRERTLKLLSDHLFRITTVVPEASLKDLRQIPVWVEVAHPKHPCMCYHPSPEWLKANDMNPAKAGGVELANCENFLKWTKAQPWMVLHEMAHGYHDRFLEKGFNNLEVLTVFHQAKDSDMYKSILHINGRKEKAYAMNNQQEYFAEQSEAFFGTNDFYPFVNAELREHDPHMHDLLGKLWKVHQ